VALAAGLMGLAVWAATRGLAAPVALLVGLPLGGLLYAPLLVLCGGLAPEDRARILEVAAKLPGLKKVTVRTAADPPTA
jgi:hypothetical protein